MATSHHDDVDPEPLISRLAGPLLPADRQAFREAALDALTRVPCWGEGASTVRCRRCSGNFSTRPPIMRPVISQDHSAARVSSLAPRPLAPPTRARVPATATGSGR